MNGNVSRWNDKTRSLVRSNPSELRLVDLENTLRMTDHLALIRYSARETLDKRCVSDTDRGDRERTEDNRLTGSDQFDQFKG